MIKAVITFVILVGVKTTARVFFKLKNHWIDGEPEYAPYLDEFPLPG